MRVTDAVIFGLLIEYGLVELGFKYLSRRGSAVLFKGLVRVFERLVYLC